MGCLELPCVADVERAHARLQGLVRQTPVVPLGDGSGHLKLENLQVSGAYKVRGALNTLLSWRAQGIKGPIIAASAGNHSIGMAWAAKKLGYKAIAVVPKSAPLTKMQKTTALGVKLIRYGSSFDEAEHYARLLAQKNGWKLLHPFDDPMVIAGQGSVGIELREQHPDCVLVPIGGGGLASGVGLAMAPTRCKVIGVQISGVDAMNQALSNRSKAFAPNSTIADGIRVARVGELTKELCSSYLDDLITVTESEVLETMHRLANTEHLIVEGAGAVAVAGLTKLRSGHNIAVVSGGNIDLSALAELWQMAA